MTTAIASATDLATGRHLRMLTTLLAGCDPCGWVDSGGSPNLYAGVALEVLRVLHAGGDVAHLVMVLPGEAAVEPSTTFGRVATDWWRTARHERELPAIRITA